MNRFDSLSSNHQIRNEDMELLIVRSHDDETFILRSTDHFNDLACWNRNGCFMVVSQGECHGWQNNAIHSLAVHL